MELLKLIQHLKLKMHCMCLTVDSKLEDTAVKQQQQKTPQSTEREGKKKNREMNVD